MEENARWNEERRDAAKSDIRRIMNAAGQSNPELRKEKIYSWENGFIEDEEDETTLSSKKMILRKDDLRKSGQALTKQLKEKVKAEMGSKKSDIRRQKGCSKERLFSQERKRYILGRKDSSRIEKTKLHFLRRKRFCVKTI